MGVRQANINTPKADSETATNIRAMMPSLTAQNAKVVEAAIRQLTRQLFSAQSVSAQAAAP
jgi:hypothetical protein